MRLAGDGDFDRADGDLTRAVEVGDARGQREDTRGQDPATRTSRKVQTRDSQEHVAHGVRARSRLQSAPARERVPSYALRQRGLRGAEEEGGELLLLLLLLLSLLLSLSLGRAGTRSLSLTHQSGSTT